MPIAAEHLPALRRLPLFAGVPKDVVDRLLHRSRLQHFGGGSVLFREGQPADSLYVAIDSHLCLKAGDGRGQSHVIEFVRPGEPVILAAVVLGRPFLMTAEIVRATDVLIVPADEIRRSATASIALSQSLNASIALQWRGLIGQIKSLKMQTGPQRLAAFLTSLVESRSDEATVELPCERQALATWLGMVPATASRAFKELSRLGVEGRGRTLKIRSVRRLNEFAAGL